MAVPAVTPLPAAAAPQVFMGVAGENGYMVMGSDAECIIQSRTMADPIIITAIAVIITVITVAVMCRGQGTTSRNHPNTNIKNTKKTAANTAGTTTAVTTITTIDPGQESGKRLNPTNRTISPLPRELSAPIPGEQFSCYIPSLPKSPNRAFSKGSPVATSGGGCLYMYPLRRLSRICFSYRLSA